MEDDVLSVPERVKTIAADTATRRKVEFVHSEVSGTRRDSVVRVYIDKPGGVTLDDCSEFSRDMETVLEAEDFIPGAYVLEISSPGIERELYSIGDFVRFAGETARVKLDKEISGQKNFVGRIASVDGTTIEFDDRTAGPLKFDYTSVVKANLKLDLGKELKGRRDR